MDKKDCRKRKRKSTSKSRTGKKKTTEGPTCSMFLVDLSRKLAQKKKEEAEASNNIVASILESLTNALPVVVSKASPPVAHSPVNIETLQKIAPELQRNDLLEIPAPIVETTAPEAPVQEIKKQDLTKKFKMPKMPVVSSDVFKQRRLVPTMDAAVNTSSSHDMASHLAKYVDTLKKISLIAEEFNQKTAKNLKEIVDSVQEDLQGKLEELIAEQKQTTVDQPMQVDQEDIYQAGPAK